MCQAMIHNVIRVKKIHSIDHFICILQSAGIKDVTDWNILHTKCLKKQKFLIRLQNSDIKKKIMTRAHMLKNQYKIEVNDYLTEGRLLIRALLYAQHEVKNVWVRDGSILFKMKKNNRVHQIQSYSDLKKWCPGTWVFPKYKPIDLCQ